MTPLDGHRTAEQRSWVYHERVAQKILMDPTVIERARARLKTILEAAPRSAAARYARGWSRLIEGPVDELVAFIISDSQDAKDFRQSSPFAGALSPRERWQLWRQAGKSSSPPGGKFEPR